MRLPQTPSQTVGPFFKPALIRSGQESLVTASTRGERVAIEGCVLDGDAAAVSDAMIELWQANADGCYDHPEEFQEKIYDPDFRGFGRSATDERGRFRFHTIKPGPVAGPGTVLQAPHINVSIFARGLLKRLVTRIYFPDEPLNAGDAVLNAVAPARRSTLVAQVDRPGVLRFDIVLQGEHETVFFDV
ncbi:MAG TPA: protocatechuate 3,4-dioxygenase subunit alpha [Verrucomicrobiae bacterium]|jgi:protocatechuate 3,4-dioxygenase alpha subunit|nr:protocatechuate 3,4-dioxygenase subunit alpha [Verrucomicrobiae bacterium]